MRTDVLVVVSLLLPALAAIAAALMPDPRSALRAAVAGSLVTFGVDMAVVVAAAGSAMPLSAAGGWLRVDALSAFHLGLLGVVHGLSSVFAISYFGGDLAASQMTRRQARTFGGLWCASLASMTLLVISDNVGVMWVGMEATTLLTAFLITIHVSRESLEAMWKYVLICSVAVALAFMGTLLIAAAAPRGATPEALFWTHLLAAAPHLDPRLARAAFVFLIVGYGTKAGLAPMHNWLPDAHSQAPAPVSALFSGFMLNGALYCIMRFLPVLDRVPGNAGWGQGLMVGFGLVSLFVGAGFILFQRDAKRLLAYCSVEHIGLVALGVGLGGLGTFAALFHSLNHSLAKSLAFFAVGRLEKTTGGHEIARLAGALSRSPLWGLGLLGGLLGLVGAAPLATFISELQLARAAFETRHGWLLAMLLAGLSLAFVGMLRHLIPLVWGRPAEASAPAARHAGDLMLVAVPLLALLVLGLWLPVPLARLIADAARVVAGGPEVALTGILR